MPNITFISGTSKTFSMDATTLGALTSVTFEIYELKNKTTIYQYKYPLTTGFKTVTLVGATHSFTLTNADSDDLEGLYGIKVEWVKNGSTYIERVGTLEIEA